MEIVVLTFKIVNYHKRILTAYYHSDINYKGLLFKVKGREAMRQLFQLQFSFFVKEAEGIMIYYDSGNVVQC